MYLTHRYPPFYRNSEWMIRILDGLYTALHCFDQSKRRCFWVCSVLLCLNFSYYCIVISCIGVPIYSKFWELHFPCSNTLSVICQVFWSMGESNSLTCYNWCLFLPITTVLWNVPIFFFLKQFNWKMCCFRCLCSIMGHM